jgi:hypothetical protein
VRKDPNRHAFEALETAKEDLRRDRYLVPAAFIVTDEEIIDFNIQFSGSEEKAVVYAKLVDIAKEKHANAIITINDAQITDAPTNDNSHAPRKSTSFERREESLYLTISGPGIETWTVSVPYYREHLEIPFGKQFESSNDILNFLPGWGGPVLPSTL